MKIVITDSATVTKGDVDLSFLKKYGEVENYEATTYEQTAERIANADIVLCNKTLLDKKNLSAAKNLKYIGLFATGYNNIDIEYARMHNITVCNAGSYSTNAVVQHTFALMLEMCGSIGTYSTYTKEGGWKKSPTFSSFIFEQSEIYGKTLGIVGYGSIGSAVAKVASAFGMNVIVYTRTAPKDGGVELVSFDELLARSDIITVHCPLTPQTKGMFCAAAFEKCKDGVKFINTSRGPVVNEEDLAAALKSGKVSAAALDVLVQEPMSEDCVLCGLDNLIITPHVAWAAPETRQRLLNIVEKNLKGYLNGNPVNVVS